MYLVGLSSCYIKLDGNIAPSHSLNSYVALFSCKILCRMTCNSFTEQ